MPQMTADEKTQMTTDNFTKDAYYSTLSKNILALNQLEEIIKNFQRENIATIIFKGLMLAELVYGDLGKRPSGDFDLLIKKEALPKADYILRELGYYTTFDIKNLKEIHFSNYRNSFFYLHQDKQCVPVHMYWHLINLLPYNRSCNIDIDRVWLEAIAIKLGSVSLHTFSINHQLIYLSMHALSHAFYPPRLLSDIKEFLRSYKDKIDWDRLVEEAFIFGLDKHVYYTLSLADKLLGTGPSEDVLNKLKPKRMSLCEKRFIASALEGKPNFTAQGLLFLGMNETLQDKFSFLLRALFLPKSELAFIKQKDASQINILDYISRIYSGINLASKQLFSWLT